MLFIPFKVDISLSRIPFITLLIAVICIYMLFQQANSEKQYSTKGQEFCEQKRSRTFNAIKNRISGEKGVSACYTLLSKIINEPSPQQTIQDYANSFGTYSYLDEYESYVLVNKELSAFYANFQATMPANLTEKYSYNPQEYSPINMVSAAFLHADWSHLIGNLIFFFAFAASIEVILGYFIFPIFFLACAISSHLLYSAFTFSQIDPLSTIGLSGVVMSMLGAFLFIMPKTKIKCFIWVLLLVRVIPIPAILLGTWFIGWDIYNIFTDDGASNINFAAHLGGAFSGYIFSLVFFRGKKKIVQAELQEHKERNILSKTLK